MVREILKWALLVLAAGFVGYFGRYLAMELIRRMRRGEPAGNNPEARGDTAAAGIAAKKEKKRLKTESKLEKKRLKAQQKKEDG
ncbi:MAG: hypothetical protein JXA62_06200 [Candidatus Aminicenantes bacterium]|nr:hypothetical protein [Candidatus Aminicenantes bacterium]